MSEGRYAVWGRMHEGDPWQLACGSLTYRRAVEMAKRTEEMPGAWRHTTIAPFERGALLGQQAPDRDATGAAEREHEDGHLAP